MAAAILNDWFSWPDGAVLTNLIASALWVAPGALWLHSHFKCRDCWRPARVPVSGSHHHVCRKHAVEHGHVHP